MFSNVGCHSCCLSLSQIYSTVISAVLEANETMLLRKVTRSRRVHAHFRPSQPEYLGGHILSSLSGHQIGDSLSVLRQYHDLGVRYMALTHACRAAVADSGGITQTTPAAPHGYSDFGQRDGFGMISFHYLRGIHPQTWSARRSLLHLRRHQTTCAQHHTRTCHLASLIRSHFAQHRA